MPGYSAAQPPAMRGVTACVRLNDNTAQRASQTCCKHSVCVQCVAWNSRVGTHYAAAELRISTDPRQPLAVGRTHHGTWTPCIIIHQSFSTHHAAVHPRPRPRCGTSCLSRSQGMPAACKPPDPDAAHGLEQPGRRAPSPCAAAGGPALRRWLVLLDPVDGKAAELRRQHVQVDEPQQADGRRCQQCRLHAQALKHIRADDRCDARRHNRLGAQPPV